jgi:hypothetical protein
MLASIWKSFVEKRDAIELGEDGESLEDVFFAVLQRIQNEPWMAHLRDEDDWISKKFKWIDLYGNMTRHLDDWRCHADPLWRLLIPVIFRALELEGSSGGAGSEHPGESSANHAQESALAGGDPQGTNGRQLDLRELLFE